MPPIRPCSAEAASTAPFIARVGHRSCKNASVSCPRSGHSQRAKLCSPPQDACRRNYVIHTVGPVYRRGERSNAATLASCYRESIRLADDHGIKSIAFPSISTGAFGYPVHEAATIAIRTVNEFLPSSVHLEHVRFVLFDSATCGAYSRAVETLSQQSSSHPAIFEKGRS